MPPILVKGREWKEDRSKELEKRKLTLRIHDEQGLEPKLWKAQAQPQTVKAAWNPAQEPGDQWTAGLSPNHRTTLSKKLFSIPEESVYSQGFGPLQPKYTQDHHNSQKAKR